MLRRTWQAFYSNWDGLGDAFAAAWAKVAQRFAHRPEVLGLELINEPFAGVSSTTIPRGCVFAAHNISRPRESRAGQDFYTEGDWVMVPWPNPLNADAKNLQPLYDRVNAAVRKVDDEVLLMFAGIIWDNFGAGFTAPPGGPDFANRSVLAYHYYDPP